MKTAKKSAKKKRSGAKKVVGLSRKGSARAAKKSAVLRIVIDPDATPSPYAKKALAVFKEGVQREYAKLHKKGVETVVQVEGGGFVRAVPRKVGGRFVVVASAPAAKPSAK